MQQPLEAAATKPQVWSVIPKSITLTMYAKLCRNARHRPVFLGWKSPCETAHMQPHGKILICTKLLRQDASKLMPEVAITTMPNPGTMLQAPS